MILVTGGTGFLGGYLVDLLLRRGERVRILSRSKPVNSPFSLSDAQVVYGDVTNRASLDAAFDDVEVAYHVAGRVDFNPPDMRELLAVNERGTRNVLDAAKSHGVRRVVHVSSVSTIGGAKDPRHPLSEEDFGKGSGVKLPYPQSKLRGERVALEFAALGFPVVIANPTLFIGPFDHRLSSARTIVSFVRRQVRVGLRTGGLGLTDVRDIVQGLTLAMEKGKPGRRYILGGHNLLLHEYHALIEKESGLPAPRIRLPAPLAMLVTAVGTTVCGMMGIRLRVGVGDIRLARHYWLYNYARAREELGLRCRLPEESIRDTLRWLAKAGYYKPKSVVADCTEISQCR